MATKVRSRVLLLAPVVAMSVAGCAVYGREVRSMPAVGTGVAKVHPCPSRSGLTYFPDGGAELCFSLQGVEVEVEAMNADRGRVLIGPLVPLVPLPKEKAAPSEPLEVEIGLMTKQPYAFDPWRAVVRTAQGEAIPVSRVSANLRVGNVIDTVELDPRAQGTRDLPGRFFLVFDRHLAPERDFSLTFQLIGPDGAEVPVPTIWFKAGKVGYFGSVP